MKTSLSHVLAGGLVMLSIAVAVAGDTAQAQSAPMPAAPVASPPSTSAADLEPAVDTSASSTTAVARPASGPTTAAPSSPGIAAKPESPRPDAATDRTGAPRSAPRPAGRAMDRVDLESSQITGNRELPRVLYIVPWRAPEAGDLEGRPVNSLLYELTRPVDRDVFRRENRYFDALLAQSPNADASAAAPAVEK